MTRETVEINGQAFPVYRLDTVIIGSGCAGYNAADCLYDYGHRNIAVVTRGRESGTSRNAGSDKQTYYRPATASEAGDSVSAMAEALFGGGSVHGDLALCEAAAAEKCFYKLVHLGVPFPANRYGEYVGYRTDHDQKPRATSAGPYTSRYMTECLERSVIAKGIRIFDDMQAIRLIVDKNRVLGVVALDLKSLKKDTSGLTLFRADNVIIATGGPANIYRNTVYPLSQTGMTGMALLAGAQAENLMEWQYGLASVKFRWNVSGTYQQVLPRYISVDQNGLEREFLNDCFKTPQEVLDMIFLKGYEWPFNVSKLPGSSRVDLYVHRETHEKGNRVFLDFTRDPSGLGDFSGLSSEAYRYLKNSGALLPTPVARLEKMNPQAIELYRDHGIDLYTEPLEIAVCPQHHNGGIAVDDNWRSTVTGLYAAGEAAGTFGAARPGGAALNATQAGAMRAAEHIAFKRAEPGSESGFNTQAEQILQTLLSRIKTAVQNTNGICPKEFLTAYQKEFDSFCAHIRPASSLPVLYQKRQSALSSFFDDCAIASPGDIPAWFLAFDTLVTQAAVLSAMDLAAKKIGSRGSALVMDDAGEPVGLDPAAYGYTVRTQMERTGFDSELCHVRPIPYRETWFETVWREFQVRRASDQ